MITGSKDELMQFIPCHHRFEQAFKALESHDLGAIACGKYPICGDDIFLIIQSYQTRELFEIAPETHRVYIDLQYMIEGAESFGYLEELLPKGNTYSPENDIEFHELQTCKSLELRKDQFVILFPGEAHLPCGNLVTGTENSVKKAVLKIRM